MTENDEQEEPALLAKLNDGSQVPVHACDCNHCKNEWFIAALSDEWTPNYCPYCGIKFLAFKRGGEPVKPLGEKMPYSVRRPDGRRCFKTLSEAEACQVQTEDEFDGVFPVQILTQPEWVSQPCTHPVETQHKIEHHWHCSRCGEQL